MAVRTAEQLASHCSATACWRCPAGGRYTLENIVPACGSCNTSKCNDEVTGWLRRKRLNEGSFLLRYFQIKTQLAVRFSAASDG